MKNAYVLIGKDKAALFKNARLIADMIGGYCARMSYNTLSTENNAVSTLMLNSPEVAIIEDCPSRPYAINFMVNLAQAERLPCDISNRFSVMRKAPLFIFLLPCINLVDISNPHLIVKTI